MQSAPVQVLWVSERFRITKVLQENKAQLRLPVDLASAMMLVTGAKGCASFVNERWLAFTGGQLEQEVGMGWTRRVHPKDLADCLSKMTAAVEARREFRIRYRVRRADGAYRWIRHVGVPLFDSGGRFDGHAGVCVDITNRGRLRHLRRARNYLQCVIDSSLDMIISVDLNRRIVEFNKAAEARLGYSGAEVIGQPIQMLYADPEEARRIHESIRATGRYSGEVTNRTKTGEDFISHLEASQLHDLNGHFLGVMGISRDITDRKRAEAERARMLSILEKSHEDLLSILNQLRQGIVMTDHEGRITFASQSCQRLLDGKTGDVHSSHWTELFPFDPADKQALQAMAGCAPGQRSKIPIHTHTAQGQRFAMEVEILDDPRDPERKIFFIYDMTEIHDLRRLLDQKSTFHGFLGQSPIMQQVFRQIRDLAVVDTTVLIEGETGTGKELAAQAIHGAGPRAGKPFVPVNCAGLTESLIGSQLFGHKRGAFTGAIADHRGVFETANGGTIFLDEIGDLPLAMQTNLLRVLQEKEVTRVGESTPRQVDVRVIAATHQDLEQLVREGRFRKDLLYRIRVARVVVPPLRERREDIPLLVEHFRLQAVKRTNKTVTAVSHEAMRRMMQYDWPGNVRELQSAIEFACIGCRSSAIQAEDLPPELFTPAACVRSSPSPQEDAKDRVLMAIRAAKGSRTAAARLLGVSRATLYRRLHELHIDPGSLQ